MLLIPSYLGPSRIHGTGVFAAAAVKAGTLLWRFDAEVDWRITEQELQAVPESLRQKLVHHCYRDRRGFYVLGGDNTKFMNHADQPNCRDVDDDHVEAARDIAAGEELTCDYRSFDADSAGIAGPLFGDPVTA